MPFPNGFPIGGNSGINTNLDPSGAPGPSHQPSANAQRSNAFWSRVQSGMANESSGRNAHNLASTIGSIASSVFSIGPSFNNFFRAVDSVYGQRQTHPDPHLPPPATHTNPAYAQMLSGHDIGTRMAPIFASFEHGIRSGLEHIFANMDSELITQKLRTFQLEQQAYLRNGMTGPKPIVPDCVPAHLREFVALLDPSDESFGHAMLEMVKKDGDFQQQQSNRNNQLIGNARIPDPRRPHHHEHPGGEFVLDTQNNVDIAAQQAAEEAAEQRRHDELYEDLSPSFRPESAASSVHHPTPYQRPRVSNPEDESSGPPPPAPGSTNGRLS